MSKRKHTGNPTLSSQEAIKLPAAKKAKKRAEDKPKASTHRSTAEDEHSSSEEDGGSESESPRALETAAEELARMQKGWLAPIYALFSVSLPSGEPQRRYHTFACKKCGHKIDRYLDTQDHKSTGNMHKHANKCFGEDVAKQLLGAKTVKDAQHAVKSYLEDGKITVFFERKEKGKVTYSHRAHTAVETRVEIVRWVSESLRPFSIVDDRGFRELMLTGRPGYKLPSAATVSRDVKEVFARTRNRIAEFFQNYRGRVSFTTDGWTSPNHRAYIALGVHFEKDGVPMSMLLDFVELAVVST
ncbi:hypothetical protein ONZ51_g11117 [Trametes cubensis]|uniref:Uncharacterized protein n=1 Tax=Trametes cubensis TaxID=1111947 RepID=A0AAD7TKS2_9APHY|nr:hypothetical protein ONZ51_g11117 [Trametes cubensis]